MARILLIGGTGAIGEYLQQTCLNRGHTVAVTTRRDRANTEAGISYHKGNALDPAFTMHLLESTRYDAVVDFMVYRTADFRDRVESILKRTEHYVYLSSYRVFADTDGEPITETTPRLLDVSDDLDYLSTDEYALAKARQEDILRTQPCKNWTIVRPSITYAQNRVQFGCLEAVSFLPRAVNGLPVAIPEEMLKKRTTMTWAGDVADMIGALLLKPIAMASDFNVTASENRSWRDIGEIYRDAVGLKLLPVSLSDYLSLGVNRYQVHYDRMFDRVCDNTKIRETTGLEPAALTAPEEGLRRSLANTTIGAAALSRLQGRMDALTGLNRLTEARCWKEAASYAIGHSFVLNRFSLRVVSKRFAPGFDTS